MARLGDYFPVDFVEAGNIVRTDKVHRYSCEDWIVSLPRTVRPNKCSQHEYLQLRTAIIARLLQISVKIYRIHSFLQYLG